MYICIFCKIVHVCADLGIVVLGGEQRGKVDIPQQRGKSGKSQARIQRREWRAGGSGPPLANHKLYGVL